MGGGGAQPSMLIQSPQIQPKIQPADNTGTTTQKLTQQSGASQPEEVKTKPKADIEQF